MSRVRNASRTWPLAFCMWKIEPSLGRDAGRILAAMLQQGQRVVDLLVDRSRGDDADDAAHAAEDSRMSRVAYPSGYDSYSHGGAPRADTLAR